MADLKQGTTVGGNEVLHAGNFNPANFLTMKGDVGGKGAPGAKGATGAKGAPGADSAVEGPKGAPGANSTVAGPKGEVGAKGATGAKGAPGAKGATGAPGAASTVAGPKGAPGAKGATGAPGAKGATGTNTSLTTDYRVYSQQYFGNNQGEFSFYDNSNALIRTYVNSVEKQRLYSNGDCHFSGDVVGYSSALSDKRLKDNITTIDGALDKVLALRGVEYDWNTGSRKGKRDLGLIAQEVETVIPNVVYEHEMPLVEGAEEGVVYKTVDYEKLIGVLVEAVKELNDKINKQ